MNNTFILPNGLPNQKKKINKRERALYCKQYFAAQNRLLKKKIY